MNLPSSYKDHFSFSKELLKEEDVVKIFFNNLSKLETVQSSRNEVVYHLLKTYYVSQRETKPKEKVCQLIKKKLESHACIPTAPDGSVLRKCTDIVDPKATFSKLFEESDHRFPIERLADDLPITALKHAGMMHSSITWELATDRAQSIKNLMTESSLNLKALQQVSLILSTMSSNVSGEPPSNGLTIMKIFP